MTDETLDRYLNILLAVTMTAMVLLLILVSIGVLK